MTRKEELLAAYDEAWDHRWESIESVLKDLSEEEAGYQHPAYKDEPPEDGHPLAGTVMWYLVHLPHCYKHYAEGIAQRPAKVADPSPPEAANVGEAIENLKRYRAELRATVAALSESQLDEKLGSGGTVIELVRASIRHDAWHAGQIAVARRLWRMRDAAKV